MTTEIRHITHCDECKKPLDLKTTQVLEVNQKFNYFCSDACVTEYLRYNS